MGNVSSSGTVGLESYVYAAIATSTAIDSVSVSLSSTQTVAYVTCLEFSGVSAAFGKTFTASGTATSSPIAISISSATPTAGDLVYAYTGYTTCKITTGVTYDSSYTASNGEGTDYSTTTACGGGIFFQINEADMYASGWSAGSTSATFSVTQKNNPSGSTNSWNEIVIDFEAPVTLQLQYSIINSGTPATISLSGCSVSPTSITADGSIHTITSLPSCSVLASLPSDGTGARYRFSSSTTSLVQTESLCSNSGSSPCAPSTGFTSVTSANTLVVVIGAGGGSSPPAINSISDSLTTQFNLVGSATQAFGGKYETALIYSGTAPSSGSDSISITWTTNGNHLWAQAYEVSGVASSPVMVTGSCAGSSCTTSSSTSGSLSYGVGDFLIGVTGGSTNSQWTAGSGFTLDYSTSKAQSAAEHLLPTTSGSTNFPFGGAPGSNQAWAEVGANFESASTHDVISSCSSGTCSIHSATAYYQLKNTYQDTPAAQTTWDSGLSGASPIGTLFGSSGTSICSITLTSGGGATSCSGWADYGTSVVSGTSSSLSGPPANSQWMRGACSFTQTNGGNAYNCNWYKQWTNTYSISAGGTTWGSGLSLGVTGTSLGTSSTICSINPTSGGSAATCSGYSDNNQVANFPASFSGTSNTRWENSNNGATNTVSITSGGGTFSSAYKYQLQNTYQVTAKAQSTFDTSMSWTVTGTYLGTTSSTICTISSSATSTDSCSAYADYDTQVTIPQAASNAPTNSRWQSIAVCTFTQTTGGAIDNCNSYKQWSTIWQITALAQNNFDPSMTVLVNGTLYGSTLTLCTITTTASSQVSCSAYIDNNKGGIFAANLTGSPANSRWENAADGSSTSAAVTSGASTVNVNYYKQWTDTYSVSPFSPATFDSSRTFAISGTYLGVVATICSINPASGTGATACSGYSDNGAVATLPASSTGGASYSRWENSNNATQNTPSITSGLQTFRASYDLQLQNTYKVSANAQTNFDTGMTWSVTGSYLGSASTICTITSTSASSDSCSGYSDNNTQTTIPQAATNSPSSSRWQSASACIVTPTSGGNTYVCQSYKQWTNDFLYSLTGGGTPNPALSCYEYGSLSILALTTSSQSFWCDNGAVASATDPAPNSNSTDRWSDNAQDFTITSGGGTSTFAFYHQFALVYSYLVSGGVSGYSAPSLNCTQFGGSYSSALTVTAATHWCDISQSWNITNPLSGSGSTERWQSPSATSGTVTTNLTTTFTYYNQFKTTFGYADQDSSAIPSGSTIGSYITFATPNTIDASSSYGVVSPSTAWVDAGTGFVTYQTYTTAGNSQRWDLLSSPATFTVSSSTTISENSYAHQYSLTVKGGNGITYSLTSETGDNFWNAGDSLTVSSDGIWGRSSGIGQRVASWNTDGGTNTSVATTGSVTTNSIAMNSAHIVNFNDLTQYQLTLNSDANSALASCSTTSIPGDSYWYDSGTSVSCNFNGVYGTAGSTRTTASSYSVDSGSMTAESTTGIFAVSLGAISAPHQINVSVVIQYLLTINAVATSISSITNPSISGDSKYWYDSGTVISVTLNGVYDRSGNTGERISNYNWDGATNTSVATTSTITLSNTMSSAHTLNMYAVTQYLINISSSPSAGGSASISTSPNISGDIGWYDNGTQISISAAANTNYFFSSWTSSSTSVTLTTLTSQTTTAKVGAGANITANFVPNFSIASITPSSPVIDVGQSITLSTTGASGGKLGYTYQWYQSSDCSTGLISGEVGTSYSPSQSATTSYCIMATDSIGDTANASVTVTVNGLPSIPSGLPTSIAFDSGQSYQFAVSASGGSGSLIYSWTYIGLTQLSGCSASSNTCTLTASSQTSATVKVTIGDQSQGTGGAYPSSSSTVTVNPALLAPSIFASLASITTGQSSSFISSISTGTFPYTYQWLEQAPGSSGFSVITGASTSSYIFATSSSSALGTWQFKVNVTDATGVTVNSSVVSVTVSAASTTPQPKNNPLYPPAITASLPSVSQGKSSSIQFQNSIGGTAPYSYQWYSMAPGTSSFTEIAGATQQSYVFVTSTNTSIGTWSFQLVVVDSLGYTVPSNVATVTVSNYLVTFNLTASGGTAGAYPDLALSGCDVSTTIINASQGTYTLSAAPNCSIRISLPNLGTTSRYVFENGVASISFATCNSGECQPLQLTYYLQYKINASYSVLETTQENLISPYLNYTSAGAHTSIQLTLSIATIWVDSGSNWSVQTLLQYSNKYERWITPYLGGALSGSLVIDPTYYHQYYVNSSFRVIGGASTSAPLMGYVSMGSSTQVNLTNSTVSHWMDASSRYTLQPSLNGSSAAERWSTLTTKGDVTPSLAASGIYATYYTQFSLDLSYTIIGGGAGYESPTLNYVSFGTDQIVPLATSAPRWGDSGSTWSVPNLLSNSQNDEQWSTNQTVHGSISGPLSFTIHYQHTYLVQFNESGLAAGANWSVVVNNRAYSAAVPVLPVNLPPGVYNYHVVSPIMSPNGTTAYYSLFSSGTLNINKSLTVQLPFTDLVPTVVNATDSNISYTLLEKNFTVLATRQDNQINITLTSLYHTGPRVLVVNLDNESFHGVSLSSLVVSLNGNPVAVAGSVSEIMNTHNTSPLYLISQTSTGYQLMVYIPHFSTNTVLIQLPSNEHHAFPFPGLEYVLAAALLVCGVVIGFVVRRLAKARKRFAPNPTQQSLCSKNELGLFKDFHSNSHGLAFHLVFPRISD